MKTINKVELNDESQYPDDNILKEVLEDSYPHYCTLLELYESKGLVPEWRYYNDGKSWLCKVQKKKKTIVWMSAWRGYMQAAIYVPVRLLDEILALDLPDEIKNHIENTKNVGKSKPCIFEIRDDEIIMDFEKVIDFKIEKG